MDLKQVQHVYVCKCLRLIFGFLFLKGSMCEMVFSDHFAVMVNKINEILGTLVVTWCTLIMGLKNYI
jgi:hypothetical protein